MCKHAFRFLLVLIWTRLKPKALAAENFLEEEKLSAVQRELS